VHQPPQAVLRLAAVAQQRLAVIDEQLDLPPGLVLDGGGQLGVRERRA
jgi:hypothetical protein